MEQLLWVPIGILVLIVVFLWKIVDKLSSDKIKLVLDNRELYHTALYYQNAFDKKLVKSYSFDETTIKLIALAVSSHSENEARTAALQACKRIKKITK